jgi:hypothetical protein
MWFDNKIIESDTTENQSLGIWRIDTNFEWNSSKSDYDNF